MIRIVGKSKNRRNIYMSFLTDKHLKAHPDITDEILKEAIEKIEYVPPFQMVEVKFDRVIGKTNCVELQEGDVVEYHRRKGRWGETPFVRRDPEDTDSIVIGICDAESNLELPTVFTAFFGHKAEREPWDKWIEDDEELERSKKFWSTHALCYDETIIL